MTGALTQLVAQGPQDKYLTGNPQTSFFRQVYKRHTNFALENVREVLKGEPLTGTGGFSTVSLQKSGDLVNGMYLIVDGDDPPSVNLASMVDSLELHVGDQKIDEYSGASICTLQNSALIPKSFTGSLPTSVRGVAPSIVDNRKLFLPLNFFCCNDVNSPLPLVSLQYHDVTIRILWNSNYEDKKIRFYANYVYLDIQEREDFSQTKQELLITQHQEIVWSSTLASNPRIINLPFIHPVKVLLIVNGSTENDGDYDVFGPSLGLTGRMTLRLNGQERFETQSSLYFTRVQPYYYGSPYGFYNPDYNPFVYSFAIDYGSLNPCGTLNFSRIDNAEFRVTRGTLLPTLGPDVTTLRCIAINYNILKCENGMGGLVFAN